LSKYRSTIRGKEKKSCKRVIANSELALQNEEKKELLNCILPRTINRGRTSDSTGELRQLNEELEQQTQNLKQQQEELQMTNDELEEQTQP
jgi:hypothetical protein